MLATKFTCPACGAVLKMSAAPAPGKKIKCPECEEIFSPAESDGPRSKGNGAARSNPDTRARGEENITTGKSKQHPRPVVSPADDEDEDSPRPRKRRKKVKQAGLNPAILWGSIGAGALILLVGGIALAFAFRGKKPQETTVAANTTSSSTISSTIPVTPTQPTLGTGGTENANSGIPEQKPVNTEPANDTSTKPTTPVLPVSNPVQPHPVPQPILEPPPPPYKPSRLLTGLSPGFLAPDLQGPDLTGKPFKLSDYRGKVVLIDFWGHWCPWCQKMYPYERELGQRLAKKPFALLGVNNDPSFQTARGILAQEKILMRCWFDGQPGLLGKMCAVEGYPTFLLVDHKGVIQRKHSGFIQDTKSLDEQIDTLVAAAEAEPKTGPDPTKTDVATSKPANPKAPRPPLVGFGEGFLAADIEGKDLDGKVFTLEELRGQVVVMDFWGHWCPHCRTMYPYERELSKRMKDKPFALLGVNTDRNPGDARAVLDKEEIAMRSWFDAGRLISSQYGIGGYPTLYVIDHKGVIRKKHAGAMTPEETQQLDKLLDTLVAAAKADPKK
jgi:thiol-disulfide isomerase/thioredoxin